jgi:hypothetical protein
VREKPRSDGFFFARRVRGDNRGRHQASAFGVRRAVSGSRARPRRRHVRVRVRGDGKVALADLLADSRPRHPAEVEQADPPVAQVVRREGGHAGCPQARPIAVRNLSTPNPWNTRRSAVRSSRGTSSSTAANTGGGTCTQRARLVLLAVCETRQRERGSSTSPHVSDSSSSSAPAPSSPARTCASWASSAARSRPCSASFRSSSCPATAGHSSRPPTTGRCSRPARMKTTGFDRLHDRPGQPTVIVPHIPCS